MQQDERRDGALVAVYVALGLAAVWWLGQDNSKRVKRRRYRS